MARLFDNANTEYLSITDAPKTAQPFTVAGWFYPDDVTNVLTLWSVGDISAADSYWRLEARGNQSDRLTYAFQAPGESQVAAVPTGSYLINTWHHAVAIEVATNSHKCILDGDLGDIGSDGNTRIPTGIDTTRLGYQADSGPANAMSGALAEWAMWNVALSNEEISILALGVSPLLVRPNELLAYWPMIGGNLTTEPDIVGGFNLAESASYGTRNGAHSRVFNPAATPFQFAAAAAAGELAQRSFPRGINAGVMRGAL